MDFSDNNLLTNIESINTSISNNGFSEYTIQLIDNYISKILNGKTNLIQFNQKEHAGLCCAGEALIGAYIVCNYAKRSLKTSTDSTTSKASPANWEIDELQEKNGSAMGRSQEYLVSQRRTRYRIGIWFDDCQGRRSKSIL